MPHLKAAIQQQSATNSFAANPDRVQQASTQAPFISLYIKVDVNFDKALLLMRDSDTGDVVRQIPSENQLEAYRRAQEVLDPTPAPVREESTTDSVSTKVDANPQPVAERAPAPQPAPKTEQPQASLNTSA